MSTIRQWRWTYVWLKDGQARYQSRCLSFSDARHLVEMELRRRDPRMVEAGYQPVILFRDVVRN